MIGNTVILDERLGNMTDQLNDLVTQIERLIRETSCISVAAAALRVGGTQSTAPGQNKTATPVGV